MTTESKETFSLPKFVLGMFLLVPSICILLMLANKLPGTETHLFSQAQYQIIGGLSGTALLVSLMLLMAAFGKAHKGIMLTFGVLALGSIVMMAVGVISFTHLMA